MVVRYSPPRNWVAYEFAAVQTDLLEAKAALLALTQIPYQRSWADELQRLQLKREVAGTSRIEGAEFTERELDAAMRETPEQLETRSQKQAAAAAATYQWIARLQDDRPVDESLILEVHRRLVTECDDDHCPPGQMRKQDENVTFGAPRHRGVEGAKSAPVHSRHWLKPFEPSIGNTIHLSKLSRCIITLQQCIRFSMEMAVPPVLSRR